mmetsp:Transcript_9622/g.14142  ORF Transcript_9622/g.14142 Transcript_9622/m.14142 type:complete len:147 (-) Transcript_9622:86-526(-)|eukprot:CAMPEP_0194766016 /NCGR_PEP_ID=MMETSP0323_2-20130528/27979_1 /TAXON_ID=2866 ORGANISM="Crypthecodinium cohnii, Strain Seligo" /NCGR_SAMPLE_ID=MMETSP0323_2 /ASSEMBLY_ACC=CAM_ASM_000346 /LENGTH=146 /DNA_ID=CAMNT_0039696483 /DNA_START=30 /DNA_END=470 /DNA_ORIENTATION=-
MKFAVLLAGLLCLANAGTLKTRAAEKYPVYSPGAAGSVETCEGITCQPVDCKSPFKYQSPEEAGTCCPLCWADSVKVPEDRSWAKGMTGGVGMNNNADPILCRDVVCLAPDCPEYDQFFDGRCCTKCKSSKTVTPANLAKDFKEMN